jgi:DNA polymerase I
MSKEFVCLIDGNAYMYRAFYAIKGLMNSKGQPTGALFGFISMLLKLIKDFSPEYIAVVFDVKGPTFRHEKYKEYKANRKPMPEELFSQMDVIKKVLDALNISVFEKQGYEADDILATLAEKFAKQDIDSYVVTGDKDALQLINDKIKVLQVHKDNLIIGKQEVIEKYGIGPESITDFLGLMGDSSDNVPGVPGVGEKTAIKLLKEFNNLENLYVSIDNVKAANLKEKLLQYEKQAILSKELTVLDRNVALEKDIEDCRKKEPDKDKVVDIFKELEFSKFLKQLDIVKKQTVVREIKTITGVEFLEILKQYTQEPEIVFLEYKESEIILKIKDKQEVFLLKDTIENITNSFFNQDIFKIGFNLKEVYKKYGVKDIYSKDFDVIIAYYLLTPGKSKYLIAEICYDCIQEVWGDDFEDIQSIAGNLFYLEKLKNYFENELDNKKMRKLFYEIEMPLLKVLVEVENTGVHVDTTILKEQADKLGIDLNELQRNIYELAGEEFNINSPKQLAKILFEKLNLPTSKKTKTGFSTKGSVLEKLAKNYKIAEYILSYRTLAKLKNTYLDVLPTLVDDRNRIHTSFNQTGTATGRLSSSEPNLQNIPIKMEQGRQIRKAFVPEKKDFKIVSADYSQVELRILAHFSEEPKMIQAFNNNEDIHTKTASEIFSIKEEDVTREMRSIAKTVNFGIIYGISSFGLSKDLDIPVKQAQDFIDAYFLKFSKVRSFLDSIIEEVKQKGYAQTICDRIRYIPNINSYNRTLREIAERMALNMPMQGSSADLIKIAMIKTQEFLVKEKLKSRLVLQIHDELLLEVHVDELEYVKNSVKNIMENSMSLKVPLVVDIESGDNWLEAH